MSFAKLLVGKGEAAQARALLQPAYDAIAQGRELTDLKAAAALLADPRALQRMSERGVEFTRTHQGATERVMRLLELR